MYSVTIDKRGGLVHAPKNKITAKPALLDSTTNESQKQMPVTLRFHNALCWEQRIEEDDTNTT